MKTVMEHYVDTGEVIGKGTKELETYDIRGKGSFGPGELPKFDRKFFEIPHGRKEDWLFEKFKDKLNREGSVPPGELTEFADKVKDILDNQQLTRGDQ